MKKLVHAGLLAAIAHAVSAIALGCGQERWPVKVGTDKQAKYLYTDRSISGGELIDAVDTTIAKLQQQPWPFSWKPGAFPEQWSYTYRRGLAEFTIWRVRATLIRVRDEDDEDYHLVLKKGTKTMIADRKSTRLNSSHTDISRMPSSA